MNIWPTRPLAATFGDPVEGDTPLLLWAGSLDSASRPDWADEVTDNFPNSELVLIEGAHTPDGACGDKIDRKFLKRASAKRLDTGCVRRIELPGFVLPE